MQIHDKVFIDASEEEEYCCDSIVFICVNRRKEIVSIQNQHGKINEEILLGSMHIASVVADELFKKIDEVIEVCFCFGVLFVRKMICDGQPMNYRLLEDYSFSLCLLIVKHDSIVHAFQPKKSLF